MRITDAQVHLNVLDLESGIARMDEVGVDSVVIDEFASMGPNPGAPDGYFLRNGAFRYTTEYSKAASAAAPSRIAYLRRFDPLDPDLDDEIALASDTPSCVGLRVCPVFPLPPRPSDIPQRAPMDVTAEVRAGEYDRLFSLAAAADLPVFFNPSNGEDTRPSLELVSALAAQHPGLQLIVDHCGAGLPSRPGLHPSWSFTQFDEVCELARFANVYLKWCHAPRLSTEKFPYPDVQALLRRVIDAFGAERVMWASDWTVDIPWATWSESLDTVRTDPRLTPEELEWILGGTTRAVLSWPNDRGVTQ